MRQNAQVAFADVLNTFPELKPFANQAGYSLPGPTYDKPVGIAVWTALQKAWTSSVVNSNTPIASAFSQADATVKSLIGS